MDWLIKNSEWIFSGIGVAIIGWLFMSRKKDSSVSQSVKGSSNVTQIGGNAKIGESNDGTER